uniref:Uncharacterized protein n=1 Tax=Pristionchus pacificus TaxID=54126 RepID=A0A2A6CEC2_PRIPA|eukprot:PDM76450.1 hypothetical protein PRIPAC_40054 [Pristionchus pacificus]
MPIRARRMKGSNKIDDRGTICQDGSMSVCDLNSARCLWASDSVGKGGKIKGSECRGARAGRRPEHPRSLRAPQKEAQ